MEPENAANKKPSSQKVSNEDASGSPNVRGTQGQFFSMKEPQKTNGKSNVEKYADKMIKSEESKEEEEVGDGENLDEEQVEDDV